MSSASFFISLNDLWLLIGTNAAPQIIDVRSREAACALGRQRAQLAGEGGVRLI
jgi:hypothetical protein